MQVLIVRHADAENNAPSDFERVLTPKGKKQSKRLAAYLAGLGVMPSRIISSPYLRAKETARFLEKAMPPALGFFENDALGCGMAPEEAASILQECGEEETVILVGHEPDLSRLIAWLIGLNDNAGIAMKKCACATIELFGTHQGDGMLHAFVPPKALP